MTISKEQNIQQFYAPITFEEIVIVMIRSEVKRNGLSFYHVFRAMNQVHSFTESLDWFIRFSLFFVIG